MLKYIRSGIIIIVLLLSTVMTAQQKTYTSKNALEIFKSGDYLEAEQAYASLLKRYKSNAGYNYYYGICLLQNNYNIPQAVKSLKYATVKGVSRDAWYYLGRAYQLSYQFEEAIKQYQRFLKYASASDIRNERAELYVEQCEVGKQLSSKVYHFEVYGRDTVEISKLLSAYHPVKDVGKVTYNSDFFESGVNPGGIMYLTERGDEVYFSMKKEGQGEELYKMEKLLDGWSESKTLDAINSSVNEKYPFLQLDGATLFFSSDREGGLGGFDLYKTIYDAESKSFSEPVNLGIPFNSPKDDYLFVTDEFNNVGWFASNRETNDSIVIVYNIKWDNTVVKNLVRDMNEVTVVAAMPLSGASYQKQKNGKEINAVSSKDSQESQFIFSVADTLVYTNLSDFKCEEAKAIFKEGLKLGLQKDSLSDLMTQKRALYANARTDNEKNVLVNEIISLEKQVYGLDEQIERLYYRARIKEQETIRELVRQGKYGASQQFIINAADNLVLEDILIPDEYTFYTDDEFGAHLVDLNNMYNKLFDKDEISNLHHADSLYVWGNILTLESSKLLEEANNTPAESQNLISMSLLRKDTVEVEQNDFSKNISKAKELKIAALKLYHVSLNRKFEIYDARINRAVLSNSTADMTFLEKSFSEGKAYFRKALDMIDPLNGFDVEIYERAGAIKRSGVKAQENGLFEYVEFISNPIIQDAEDEQEVTIQEPYQEIRGVDEAKSPSRVVESAFGKSANNDLQYRIQIGVFRNEPDAEALSRIPSVIKKVLPERGLVIYYSGNYPSYSEAQKELGKVRDAGFEGAFIVVFNNDEQIPMTKELKQ